MPLRGTPVSKDLLEELYFRRGLSAQEIANDLGVSYHKISYWMDQYDFERRNRSEAGYLKHNPDGEKFRIDLSDRELFVAGIALYLGEGGKTRSSELVLTNSDPGVLQLWVRFLDKVCGVPPAKLRVHVHYYEDLDYPSILEFWSQMLAIPMENFGQPTLKRGRMAERKVEGRRIPYGTLHVRFNDSRLKSLIISWMRDLVEGNL